MITIQGVLLHCLECHQAIATPVLAFRRATGGGRAAHADQQARCPAGGRSPGSCPGSSTWLRTGCRWSDRPPEPKVGASPYGASTTIHSRFNRWSRRRFRIGLLEARASSGAETRSARIDSIHVRAQRSAHGGRGGEGARDRPLARRHDHQGSCARRRHRTTLRHRADGGHHGRHPGRADVAAAPAGPDPLPDRRQGLRCERATQGTAPAPHHAGHSGTCQPQAQGAPRCASLPRPAPD